MTEHNKKDAVTEVNQIDVLKKQMKEIIESLDILIQLSETKFRALKQARDMDQFQFTEKLLHYTSGEFKDAFYKERLRLMHRALDDEMNYHKIACADPDKSACVDTTK